MKVTFPRPNETPSTTNLLTFLSSEPVNADSDYSLLYTSSKPRTQREAVQRLRLLLKSDLPIAGSLQTVLFF